MILDPDAISLAEELDGLPLALATAGAYLDQVAISLSDYLRLYKESWLQLQKTSPELSSYEDRTLYSTWQISFNHAKQQNELSAKLLCFWAYFDNQDIWFELLQHNDFNDPDWVRQVVKDEVTFHNAMRVLSSHGLVEIDMSGQDLIESRGYSIHKCVHLWAIYVLNQTWDYDLARLAIKRVGLHVPGNEAVRPWLTQRRLLKHATRCSYIVLNGLVVDEGIELACNNLGLLYVDQGKLVEAVAMLEHVVKIRESTLAEAHPYRLASQHALALAYQANGQVKEAVALLEQVVKTQEFGTYAYVGADTDADYASKPVTRPSNDLDRKPAKTPGGSESVPPQTGHDLDRILFETTADSAYASRTHNSADTEANPGTDVETITKDIEYVLVDSAFAESQSPGDKLEMEAEDLGLYSAGSIYSASVTPSLPTPRDENYVTDLAAALFSTIQPSELDKKTLEHIFRILPGLLRAFALKVGHRARKQMHRDVSFFVHKYREYD